MNNVLSSTQEIEQELEAQSTRVEQASYAVWQKTPNSIIEGVVLHSLTGPEMGGGKRRASFAYMGNPDRIVLTTDLDNIRELQIAHRW